MKDKWLAVSIFLAGLLIAGFVGVLRSDQTSQTAAREVRSELSSRLDDSDLKYEQIILSLTYIRSEIARARAQLEILLEERTRTSSQ